MRKIKFILNCYMLFVFLSSCKTKDPVDEEVVKVQNMEVLAQNENGGTTQIVGDIENNVDHSVQNEDDFLAYFTEGVDLNGFESCGYGDFEKNAKLFPKAIIAELDLAKVDMDRDNETEILTHYSEAIFFPIAKKKMGETYILLYGLDMNDTYLFVREYRILLYQGNKVIKNILFSGSIASEGENTLCRKIEIFSNRIDLIKLDSENVENLNIRERETYFFETASDDSKPSPMIPNLSLPIDIPYKAAVFGANSRTITSDEMAMMSNLGIKVSQNALISDVGTFDATDKVKGKLQSIVDGDISATILSTFQGDEMISQLLVQKYISGQIGFSLDISESLKISRAEMFEIERNGKLELEVDHFDAFRINDMGEIVETDEL